MRRSVKVNVISDIVWPWCWIGKRSIELAAVEAKVDLDITWHPFQLDPSIPPEGKDKLAHYKQKFGPQAESWLVNPNNRLNERGRPMGIEFVYHQGSRIFNTRPAHQVLLFAKKVGGTSLQNKLQEVLFRRYFKEGQDLGTIEALKAASMEASMNGDDVVKLLQSKEGEQEMNKELAVSHKSCDGVPFFIFPSGRTISGGQEIATFAKLLTEEAKESVEK